MANHTDTLRNTSSAPVARRGWNGLDWTALVLTVIGALNWGLVGLFNLDLVAAIFGPMTLISRVVYVVVAVAGLYLLSIPLRARR